MRRAATIPAVLVTILAALAVSLPNDSPALRPAPGAGMFLILSDIHFNPYADPSIMEQLGAKPLPACQAPAAPGFPPFGNDTNFPLLRSALDHAAATAAGNHFHYDYVLVTGDFLAHDFDARYRTCVGGGPEAYQRFVSDTIRFVDRMIAKSLPGVPVFAALGNNDTDHGDYAVPSEAFLENVGSDWNRAWGKLSPPVRAGALDSFGRAGNYALPHPTAPNHELVILNSDLWAARNTQACSEADPDPGGQFQWLAHVLTASKRAGGTATLVMHILPGIDALKSSMGAPRPLWNERCTQQFIAELSDFRGVVREMYAGHIHRDDFRLLPDRAGAPLCAIHVVPSVSPVYFNNPAVEVGWYDKNSGELRDYATLYLDLGNPKPAWAIEYVFSKAYGRPRPNLAALEGLSEAIRAGNPASGVGKHYAEYYGAGVKLFLTPDNWTNYSCAQTQLTLSGFAQCRHPTTSGAAAGITTSPP